MQKEKKITEALHYLQNLCSRQEKCSFDIWQKLQKYDFDQDINDKIIENLTKNNYIDNLRYSNAFVSDKFKFNKWGKLKITAHLKNKQIDDTIIIKALDQIDEHNYKEILKQEIIKKNQNKTIDNKQYQKLYRFAQSRGFDNGLIIVTLNKIKELLNS